MFDVIKRQPALVLAFVEAVLGFVVTLGLHGLSADQSAAIIAAIVGVSGVFVGGLSADAWIGRLTGAVKAVLIVGLAYGMHLSQDSQAGLVAIVAAGGAIFIWDRNTPKVNAAAVAPAARRITTGATPSAGVAPHPQYKQ